MWNFIAFDGPTKFGSHLVHKHTNIFGGSFSSIMPHPCIQQVAHDPASFSFFQFEDSRFSNGFARRAAKDSALPNWSSTAKEGRSSFF
jgi:hypothetical protein